MKYTLRIKKNGTFRYILNKGNYKSGNYLSVHITKNNSKKYLDKNFFGICISKKNGNSVQRNKMKRWVREVYKSEEILLKKGFNIVILYKKSTKIEDLDYSTVYNEIKKCFKELDIYENKENI